MIVVVNPEAGGGRLKRRWPAIARLFREGGLDVVVAETRYAGHATRITREALRSGEKTVVAVGGDGTLHEVVNGFFEPDGRAIAPEARLGLVPAGSGSDFARTMGIPDTPALAIAMLSRGHELAIDVARLTHEDHRGQAAITHMINAASIGLSAEVLTTFGRLPTALRNPAGYALASLKALAGGSAMRAEITLDGRRLSACETALVVVGNGRCFGGGMKVLPDAWPDDGWLDVLVMEDRPTAERLAAFARLYDGGHVELPFVQTHRAREIVVRTDKSVRLEADGQLIGRAPVSVSVLPGAIRVLGWRLAPLPGRERVETSAR